MPKGRGGDEQLELALAAPAPAAPAAPAPGRRLLLAPGPRAAERRLLEEVLAAARAREERLRAGDLSALRAPLRVVVPSRSLREHLAARLVAAAGRSLLGVAVQTHPALALEALARAGRAAPRGDALAPVFVRRHAAESEALRRWLGDLEDGYGIVEGAVRDLLDAGFEPAGEDALADAIEAAVASGELGADTAGRARAVAEAALRTLASLADAGLGHRTSLLVEARDALQAAEDAQALLPTAGLWVHGYADATGLVSDWLEVLVRTFAGRVLLDLPPDPADPARREERYAGSFRQRMGGATGGEQAVVALADAPALSLLQAPGTDAEVRAVAARVRLLLDRGVAPEAIGIVTRRLEPYRGALHAQLGRLSVPFSAIGGGAGPDASTRRAAALARLLEEGGEAPVDAWLAADAGPHGTDVDLRIGLHVLGAGRLGRLARLDLAARLGEATSLPLPVRRGGAPEDAGEEAAAPDEAAAPAARARNRHRHVARAALEEARARAAALLERLEGWPARARFDAHLARLQGLVAQDLAWRALRPGCAALLEALEVVGREIPPGLALAREELVLLVADALGEAAEGPLGGAGAGVQVLTVTAARGRSFEHLFLLGMNRGAFPRAPTDDPVLPDALRWRLREVLDEMPVKERVRDEERHLFASLCAAAPQVLIAWQHADDDGRARIESPFVVRLRVARPELALTTAPAPLAAEPAADPARPAVPRPAAEHLLQGGLRDRHASLAGLRALAVGEVRAALREDPVLADPAAAVLDAGALARHQLAALRELDAPPPAPGAPPPPLGPWLGRVGRAPAPADGAEPELFVTRLEDLARCPWQAFLRRDLGLEPVPDALAVLPAPGPLLLGKVAHAVLERVVQAALPAPRETLAEALAQGPVRVPWPDAVRLEGWLDEEAARAASEEGIAIPGFARALARRVRPLLEVARASDWSDPAGAPVLGAELRGVVELTDASGCRRRIGFRADRADLDGGALRVTDYKAGKPAVEQASRERRFQAFLRAVREGRLLQAAAYRVTAGALAPGRAVEGRYLYLREDAPGHARVLAVGDDAEGAALADAFDATGRALLEAADLGLLAPRLDTVEGRPPCAWCEVQAACLQGESGQRARLAAWTEAALAQRAAGTLAPVERALLRIVRLREDARQAAADDAAGDEEAEP